MRLERTEYGANVGDDRVRILQPVHAFRTKRALLRVERLDPGDELEGRGGTEIRHERMLGGRLQRSGNGGSGNRRATGFARDS